VEALAWWLIPIAATLIAVLWVTWVSRPRRPADPHDTLAAHQRFTNALQPDEPMKSAGGEVPPEMQESEQHTRSA
jgi:hypothetical protein